MLAFVRQWVAPRLGVDLGTTMTLIATPTRGVVVEEPSVVAFAPQERRVVAVGHDAYSMLEKTPEGLVAYRPMREGVVADYRVTQVLLAALLRRALGRWALFRPEVVVSVPAGVTSTQRRAVVEATLQAGARAAYTVREPILAALGAGLPITEPRGVLVADIGGGTTDVAVMSLGGVVVAHSVKCGGTHLDDRLVEYLRRHHNLLVGLRTAEAIKRNIGSALPLKHEKTMEITGRDAVSGLPRTISVGSNEFARAVQQELAAIVGAIQKVLHATPPELIADITSRGQGIVLTGGGSQLRNLTTLITRRTGVAARVADDPQRAVARGSAQLLTHLPLFKRLLTSRHDLV